MVNIKWVKERKGLRSVVRFLEKVRNKGVLECFEDYLKEGDRILDVGCGSSAFRFRFVGLHRCERD